MKEIKKGKAKKGSQYWIQEYINTNLVDTLNTTIISDCDGMKSISWITPLQEEDYIEKELCDVNLHFDLDFSFWPKNGPVWDAIGIADNGYLVLVEAKAHIHELESKCTATSKNSIKRIKDSLKDTHKNLGSNEYDENLWYNTFYQYGNRLAWYYNLTQQGIKVILVYICFVDDYTYIPTSKNKWLLVNDVLDTLMLGHNLNDCNIKHVLINVEKSI